MKKYYKVIFPLFNNYLININESKDAELDDYISNSKMKMMKVYKKYKYNFFFFFLYVIINIKFLPGYLLLYHLCIKEN